MRLMWPYYGRWSDEHAVVHWVELQRGSRLYASCGREVLTSGNFAGKPCFANTSAVVTCVTCVGRDVLMGFVR